MSDGKDELSDEEYASLLRELEGRSSGEALKKGGKKAPSGDGGGSPSDEVEDIDAFLASLEADEGDGGAKTKTTTREEDPLAAEFAALEKKGELVAPPVEVKKPKKESKKEKETREKKPGRKERREAKRKARAEEKEARIQEKEARAEAKAKARGERSRSKEVGLIALTWAGWLFPAFLLWWVLGSYLGQWIAAGWLITLVVTMFVFTAPVYLRKLARRGSYKVWMAGFSLLATVALVAPLPNTAGKSMVEYGHWPSSALAEVAGAAPNAGFVRAHAALAGWIGGLVATAEAPGWGPRQLGTVYPLGMEGPAQPAPVAEEPAVEEPAVPAEAPQEEPVPEPEP